MQGDPWNWPKLQSSSMFGGKPGMGLAHVAGGRAQKPKGPNLSSAMLDYLFDLVAPCPWSDAWGETNAFRTLAPPQAKPLYTAAQRQRRDSTGWTLVQGILAPVQFAVFLISLGLVVNFLTSGNFYVAAAASVVVKTLVLYAIMITGAIWEKKVFGKYLFADAFFWEDTVSMLVIGLHTAYLAAMWTGWGSPHDRMILALAAYATYAINATQFLLKFRSARLDAPRTPSEAR